MHWPGMELGPPRWEAGDIGLGFNLSLIYKLGDRGSTVVKVLGYKWEGAGSIPDGVIGTFHWHNPSDRTMALGSTQPVTEMSTRSISWG